MSPAPAGRLHRAVGIETEYGITSAHLAPGRDGAPLSVEEAVREVFRDVSSPRSGTHRFTAAGARLYIDVGMHPEYAGPECVWTTDVVAQDLAGDAVLASMTRTANARLESRGARIHLLKSNTDAWGATFGCHENYQVRRDAALPMGGLVGLLAARQILAGAGALPIDRGGRADADGGNGTAGPLGASGAGGADGADGADHPLGPMRYSARADHVHGATSADPTRERAFVNTRDEPHADASRWRRLHVITADSSTLAVTGLLRTGSMAALLSLVENRPERARALAERFAFADPVGALHAFSHDPRLQVRCELAAGGTAGALEVQRAFLDEIGAAAHQAADGGAEALDEETAEILALWGEALDALEDDPLKAAHLVEWCAKLAVLERLRTRYGCGWDDARIRAADLQLGVVDPASSLTAALERAGSVRRVVDDAAVSAAVERAPADTRAGGRAVFLRAFPDRVWAASWTSLVMDIGATDLLRVTLPDPAHPTAAEVERVLERSAGSANGDEGARLVAALEALGIDIPDEPRTYAWDEGFYAGSGEGPSAPQEPPARVPAGDDDAGHEARRTGSTAGSTRRQ